MRCPLEALGKILTQSRLSPGMEKRRSDNGDNLLLFFF